jgi:hypothetical protein
MNFVKKCPNCNSDVFYKNKHGLRHSIRKNDLCKKCGLILRAKNKEEKEKTTIYKPRIDWTGRVVNCWKILGFHERKIVTTSGGNIAVFNYWKKKCVNCGIIKNKEVSHINKTKRCRYCCLMEKGQAGLNIIFYSYSSSAKKVNRSFELSLEQFKKITSSNCYYCNAIPSRIISSSAKISKFGDYVCNGIDRMDNSKGYVEGNCVPCCEICNWAKSDRNCEEFKNYIKGIYLNAKEGNIQFIEVVR